MQITDQQFQFLVKVGAPLVLALVARLRERNGTEPTLEQVQAELAADETAARAEAAAFYARHPELHV